MKYKTKAVSERAQLLISDYLSEGAENAVPLRQLVGTLHLPERVIRQMIERERRSGALICSDNQRGYYLAGDKQEAARFALSMRHRAHEILRTAEAIETAAEQEMKA